MKILYIDLIERFSMLDILASFFLGQIEGLAEGYNFVLHDTKKDAEKALITSPPKTQHYYIEKHTYNDVISYMLYEVLFD